MSIPVMGSSSPFKFNSVAKAITRLCASRICVTNSSRFAMRSCKFFVSCS